MRQRGLWSGSRLMVDGEAVAGQYTCTCADGYVVDSIARAADAVCADADCGPGGVCSEVEGGNVAGEYMCTCQDGYAGGGVNTPCADIDECAADNGGCDANAVCANTLGGGLYCGRAIRAMASSVSISMSVLMWRITGAAVTPSAERCGARASLRPWLRK